MPSKDSPSPIVVWFRDDLRLDDNPALAAAVGQGRPVVALYVLDESKDGPRALGGASRWWLNLSLKALARDLDKIGVPLVLRKGPALKTVPAVLSEAGAGNIVWNRRYDAPGIAIDKELKSSLREDGFVAESFNGALLAEPWDVLNGEGLPYRVFSPFFRAMNARGAPAQPQDFKAPSERLPEAPSLKGEEIDDLLPLPSRPDWAGGLRDTWTPGEAGARKRLEAFLDNRLCRYAAQRDMPGEDATSLLSPHLRFGEISPRRIWYAAGDRTAAQDEISDKQLDKFRSELGWREFSYHLLFHFPDIGHANFQPRFDDFPWRKDKKQFRIWTKGQTGYPLVDAGMRELWHTGYMHNRVRMVVASFLIKHLMIDWREGEAWFWDTLVDADPANNTASWQWVAGSGADAAPYFRIFNPTSQGEKFDPDGTYVRRWVPELADMPASHIYKPHEAPREMLEKAGVRLGDTYPRPMVEHAKARQRALDAFQTIKNAS
ncbi:cryptochrome/photolyase family protein [Stappia indica]|uniref:cryptochrome/photolyase family protein n=1 Tax=Stappia indica TaxID=538381 RepID=UPI001D187C08|nr:deoxyribodipyrimidine photo-lyase [Stappia indica]MCC4246394.1 DNA photolyase family protein [Stappia indica]